MTRLFDDFFEESYAGMLGRAIALCGHRHDAEDAVQEAYLEALRRWDRVGGYESPEAWVHRVMTQRLAKLYRRRRPGQAVVVDVPAADGWGPAEVAELRELLAVLGALPPVQRMVLVLSSTDDKLTQRDIARRMGITRGAVASTLFKARHNLRQVLGLDQNGRPLAGHDLFGAPAGQPAAEPIDRLAGAVKLLHEWLRDAVAVKTGVTTRAYAEVSRRARVRRRRWW